MNRVYGVIGVSSIMANWNADFSGFPKTISDGTVFGSDKALKYPMKKMWDNQGEKVVYIKSMKLSTAGKKEDEITLVPKSLKERYESLYGVKDLKECKNIKEVLSNLFQAIDVKNFGATFAEAGNNISITGAVQIGQGFNKYEESCAEEQQILSPFRDPKDNGKDKNSDSTEEAKNSTLGTKIVSNEAHYFYPFVINPAAYKEYVELGVTDGYTEQDYAKFKEAAITAVTSYATNAKVGCENEFSMFIETQPDLYLPNLDKYINFVKESDKNEIRIECSDMLNEVKDRILSIEIYYNTNTTTIHTDIESLKCFDIITRKEV